MTPTERRVLAKLEADFDDYIGEQEATRAAARTLQIALARLEIEAVRLKLAWVKSEIDALEVRH